MNIRKYFKGNQNPHHPDSREYKKNSKQLRRVREAKDLARKNKEYAKVSQLTTQEIEIEKKMGFYAE